MVDSAGGGYVELNGMASLGGGLAHGAAPLVRGTSLGSGAQWGHGADGAMASQYMLSAVSRLARPARCALDSLPSKVPMRVLSAIAYGSA